MAEHFGLGVIPWAPLAAGVLTGKYTRGGGGTPEDAKRAAANEARGRTSEEALAIARAVDEVADAIGATSAQVAVRWVMQKGGYTTIPILGARKVSQIEDTMKAATITIPGELMAKLDAISAPTLGFPQRFLENEGMRNILETELHPRLDRRPR